MCTLDIDRVFQDKEEIVQTGLTKEELNRQIVLLRSNVKKARPMEVSRLLRKMKKLQKPLKNMKGTDNKTQQKLARLVQEIGEMKKLNLNEVAKFALLNEMSISEIMRKGSGKERAVIRLTETALVKRHVAAFRERYPKWKVEVPSIYHIWSFNKKVFGVKKKKSRVASTSEENLSSTHSMELKAVASSPSAVVSRSNPSLPKCATENEKQENGLSRQGNNGDKLCRTLMPVLEESESQEGREKTRKPTLKQLTEIMMTRLVDIGKTDGEIEVKRIQISDLEDEIAIKTTAKMKCHPKDTSETVSLKVTSSFFMELDGLVPSDSHEDPLTHAEEEGSPEMPSNYSSKSNSVISKNLVDGRIWSSNAGAKQKCYDLNTRIKSTRGRVRQENSSDHRPKNKLKVSHSESEETLELLHPSWEAKRKQNVAISAFKGIKKTFEDSE